MFWSFLCVLLLQWPLHCQHPQHTVFQHLGKSKLSEIRYYRRSNKMLIFMNKIWNSRFISPFFIAKMNVKDEQYRQYVSLPVPSAGKETDWILWSSHILKTLSMELIMSFTLVWPTMWMMYFTLRLPGLVMTTPSPGWLPSNQRRNPIAHSKAHIFKNVSNKLWIGLKSNPFESYNNLIKRRYTFNFHLSFT